MTARTTLLSVLSAFVLACGGYMDPMIQEWVGFDTQGKVLIWGWEEHNSDFSFRHSPYYRIGRAYDYPVFIAIDGNGMGCFVPAQVWALTPREIKCKSGWVHPRE